jgi:hypothetical protein
LGVGQVTDFDHGIGRQMLAFRVRLSRRVKEIQQHVAQCRDLGQYQL